MSMVSVDGSSAGAMKGELIEFIVHETGLDRKTIMSVLKAEEDFLTMQITKSLKMGDRR